MMEKRKRRWEKKTLVIDFITLDDICDILKRNLHSLVDHFTM